MDHTAGTSIWQIWIPPDNGHAAIPRVEGKPQAGGKNLEKGRVKGAAEAA
jgi:hypothetical protein